MSNLLNTKYNHLTFEELFPSNIDFRNFVKETVFYAGDFQTLFTDTMIDLNYQLLYNKYGGTPIANSNVNQAKLRIIGVMWTYGPNWIQKLKIQEKLRSLGLDDSSDIYKGSSAIYNHANNPETAPSTDTLEEITYINDQNTTKYKRSRLEGLAQLMELLSDSFTDDYLNKFRKIFQQFVGRGRTYTFITDEEEV